MFCPSTYTTSSCFLLSFERCFSSLGSMWTHETDRTWYGDTHEGWLEDSFWQHKLANHSISFNFCLVLCRGHMNLYIWNVVQTEHFFGLQRNFKYLNIIFLILIICWNLCAVYAAKMPPWLRVWMQCCVCVCGCVCVIYLTVTPSFSRTRVPFSWYSSLVIQKLSLSFMMSASTAPPKNTMCLRRGGSSMRILNFYKSRSEDAFSKTTMLYNAWNYY